MIAPSPVHHGEGWHELLTAAEAVRYLRLDADYDGDMAGATRALHKLVRDGRLRPIRGCGKSYKYPLHELRRFITSETAASAQPPAGATP